MRPFLLKVALGLMSLLLLDSYSSISQVFNPNDVNVEYDPQNPPVQPPDGQPGKWVKTSRLNWNTSSFKCYIYKGIAFRLKYPKTYVPGNGQKYPLFLFFHGVGERGSIYDNEYQLYHGGQVHMNKVDAGTYDGFLLYPQSVSGYFTGTEEQTLVELIQNVLVPQVQVDPFRVSVDGLSAGGAESWDCLMYYAKNFAAILPISDAEYKYEPYIVQNKWTPIWLFQGALDNNPPPVRARILQSTAIEAGANFTYTEYPDRGHNCWYQAWAEPNYDAFISNAYKSNPWPDSGRTEFCPGENVNIRIGVAAGMDGYQWKKGDDIIAGANSNTIVATSLGTYYAKVRLGSTWSEWSPIPVVLKTKSVTTSPDPQLATFSSKVLPAPDGSTQVQLMVPNNYASYKWTAAGSNTTLGTNNTFMASPGSYQVTVTENFGCTSTPSNPFTVINANGPNKPDAVKGLVVSKLSKTSLKLYWIAPANAVNKATNFEIYMGTTAGGPYQFVGITDDTTRTFSKDQLASGKKYYFVVRAVNATAGSDLSNEVSETTDSDDVPPVSPNNLKVIGTTRNSIDIKWGASTDDVGIARYNIYVNGVKSYTSTSTSYTINNLEYNTVYNIAVTAIDGAENESPFSNQVTAKPVMMGLRFKYYLGEWDKLPDFNRTPVQSSGFVPNITLANKSQSEKYAFLWEGFIRIDNGGTYTFRTNSDDGSRLYINAPYDYLATPLVDNDGTHGAQNRDGTITLNAGVYPIVITYFQKTSGSSMAISWKKPGSGSFVTIPNSVFTESVSAPSNLPAAPSALNAVGLTYKKVALSWTDNSNNETGFELSRSTDPLTGFVSIAKVGANITNFEDSTVEASTKYYYRVRAINANGESSYDKKGRGVDYAYYETNTLSNLPDFSTLIPVQTGHVGNFSLGMQLRGDNFAVKYDGYITVPYSGNYKFSTTSDDGSELYLNNNRIVNNDGLHGNITVYSNNVNLTAGVQYPISVWYFEQGGSESLTVTYQKTSSGGGGSVNEQIIPATVLGEDYVSLTTPDAPPPPDAPTNLQVISTSSTSAKIAWTNPASGITKFEVFRSFGNNQEYILYATVPVSNTYYTDTVLFPNSTVYYKVRSVGTDSKSDFSSEISTLTLGVMPSLDVIENQYMKYGTQFKVYVNAKSSIAENLTIQVDNLPSFGSFTATGNGKGEILFNNPTAGQQNTYPGIKVTVTNPQGNATSRTFSLTVNSNSLPVVTTAQTSITINENTTQQMTLNATDADGDALNWSFSGLPSFIKVVPNNQTAQLTLTPLSGSAGTYTVIAKADDGKMGRDTLAFTVTVNPVVTQTVYVNFGPSVANTVGGKWNNNVAKVLALNEVYPVIINPGLKDENGNTTNMRFSFAAVSSAKKAILANYSGMNTGNNSGIYPDKVLSAGYWFPWNESYTMTLTGLNPAKTYNFTFLGSFVYTGYPNADVSTRIEINGSAVTFNSNYNTQNTATISGITPNGSGTVVLNISRPSSNGSSGYFLNSMVVSDGLPGGVSVPGKVNNFAGKFENGAVHLTWTNTTSVVTTHEVYRANVLQGPYTLLNPGANNGTSTSYIDNTVQGNKTYYYMVRSKNSAGGANTDVIKVVVPNKAPTIVTKEVFVKTLDILDANIQATDDASDIITLVATELPSFATFTDNGNKTGTLHLAPGAGNVGAFDVKITATDNYGASTSSIVKVYSTDNRISSVYVNFNTSGPADGIWNNFTKLPTAGASVTNLKNDLGTATSIGVTLVNAWPNYGTNGAVSGNNSGAYRDTVLQTYYAETTTSTKTVRISGLSTASTARYNLVFMSGITAYDDRTTVFTVGSSNVSVNAANNSDKTVQINGITPAADGSITFTVNKGASSLGAYLNALVIQSYTASTSLLAPDNFKASGLAKDSIKLVWNNRVTGGNVNVYRSTSANGVFTPIATVSGTTYSDFGLQSNTEYFYKLKAVLAPDESPYSVTISASTFDYSVYINFNRENPAPAPWNNTNGDPDEGAVFQNFYNEEYALTGISMTVGSGFSGINSSGMNTGNNSGIVPDKVMERSWWVDIPQTASVKFSGLSHNSTYNFKFFGSRQPTSPTDSRISVYSINGKTAKLDAAGNISRMTSIENVQPDINGEVVVVIHGENNYAYLNAMIISGGKIASNPIEGASGPVFRQGNSSDNATINPAATDANNNLQKSKLNVYPNPFRDDVMIKLNLAKSASKVVIKVTDMSGKVVMLKEVANLPKGVWQQSSGLSTKNLAPGIYIIQVQGLDGEILPPVRILKTK